MLKILLLTLLAVAVSGTSFGYNYQNSVPLQQLAAPQQHTSHHDDSVEKHYYYFNAPAEHVEHHQQQQIHKKITPQKVKKNLQVIFIKPPEEKHHARPVHYVQQAAPAVQENTHIYVLSKEPQHHVAKPVQQVHQTTTVHHHKPEVHYLNYHTPAEAQQIQHSIIQQYGGKPSDIVHGSGSSHAPIVNFISSSHKVAPQPHHHHQETVNRQYLAPLETTNVAAVDTNFLPSGPDVLPGTSYIPPV